MIGKRAEEVLNRAVRSAIEYHHEYFTIEHVLLALLGESSVLEVIRACGGEPDSIRRDLENFLRKEIPTANRIAKDTSGETTANEKGEEGESAGDASVHSQESPLYEHPVATLSIQRLIQRALFQIQSSGRDEIQPVDLLIALFQNRDSQALFYLKKQGIDRLDVLNFVSHGIRKSENGDGEEELEGEEDYLDFPSSGGASGDEGTEVSPQENDPSGGGTARQSQKDRTGAGGRSGSRNGGGRDHQDPLKLYCIDLNQRAAEGNIDPLVGRSQEMERILQTLCRRRKNNPLLIGEAGVGKTALAEGLAYLIHRSEVPPLLKNARLFLLDMGSLLAGTKFRGDFEQRLKGVLLSLRRLKKRGFLPVLVIDEIHTIIGAGSVSGGTLDAANLLKPLLTQGEIRCLGSTTYSEYRKIFEKDAALSRRFQKIDVPEPSQDEAIQILTGLKATLEEYHQLKYSPDAIRAAVELSAKHITDRFLPDKAIDLLDEAAARLKLKLSKAIDLQQEESASALDQSLDEKETSALGTDVDGQVADLDQPDIGVKEIEELVAQVARVPVRTVSTDQRSRLRNLCRDLRLSIFGQDEAVDAVVNAIFLSRSGLRAPDKPVGNFLFCGPTGVGKTELSKQLAHCLGVPFLRFDMSEYMEKHTVSRLIGAPPGYVGFEQAGMLTDAVTKNPHSVVLLDEIEKAHPDVWNILLQVMDAGVLTDNNGKKADFRSVVIIMTSNVGSSEAERRPLGVQENWEHSALTSVKRAVEKTFSPEFRNRLDLVVAFRHLDPPMMEQVVGKQLVEVESQLLKKNIEVEFSPTLRKYLATKGYDRRMGARPLARLIQEEIKRELAQEILFGKLEKGGRVLVDYDDKVQFNFFPSSDGGSSTSGGAGGAQSGMETPEHSAKRGELEADKLDVETVITEES